ncbi:S-layer homology domain-containing protein [uncultured Rothia sp.]|uniref:S-layer homology domain-containing protein n=1 Tax=uncultured Rothia sp. TaxID=316088 RepID=UPI00288BCF06|nr:S-layer homology domain-containing protein [uncultured Rothia sp.]
MMSSFFAPRGAPHHSETPRHPASARVLSLSLLLGLSPLAGITPAALAAPQEAPAQNAPVQNAPAQNEPAQGDKQDASLPTLRVSSGSLDILHGGTVHVEGTGLSPDFLAHHELRSLTIAPKGSSTYANPYQKVDHRGLVFDSPKPAADGSFSADLTVPANSLPANLEYEVILTYRPVDDAHPYAWNTEDRVRAALPVEFNLPKAALPSITYDVSAISEEQIASGQPVEVTLTGTGFQDVSSLKFTLSEHDEQGKVTNDNVASLGELKAPDTEENQRIFEGLIPNGYFQKKVTIPAGVLKSGKGYSLGVSGVETHGWPKLTRKFPFVPVGNNPARMAYQDNSFRNTLPKVSVAAQDFDPGQDRVYKVTISNISPEVDLGYYLDSVSIYNATSDEQAPFARNDVAGQYDKQDELVTRNADGTLTVEVEYKVHGDSSYRPSSRGSMAEVRAVFSDSKYSYGSHKFTVSTQLPMAPPAADAVDWENPANVKLKVDSGTLNISQGGTVSVTTSPLSAEFRQKYAFYELALVTRGSVYVYEEHHSYPPLEEYGGGLKDLDHQVRENPDGSLTYTFKVPPQYLEVANGTLFDVVMSYYPLDENEPEPSSRSNRLYARAHIDTVQEAQPTRGTYTFSQSAIDNPWKDTTLRVEGRHVLVQARELIPNDSPVIAIYEADPATGKMVGEPVFTQQVDYTYSGVNTRWFRNNYFSAELKIPAGTLKPGKLYFIGMYGGGLPYPGMEDSPGSMLNDVAEFLPVHSPEQESTGPALHLGSEGLNPYAKTNSFTARATGLSAPGEGSYRLSVQHVDEQGHLTGQTVLQQAIPTDRIQDGRVEMDLTIAQQLSYSGAYRLVLEKVTPGKDGAGESVEQLAVEDIHLKLMREDELQAAKQWFADRDVLPNPSPMSWHSGVTRHDVTVSLYRLAGSPKVELPATSPYADVATSDPDYAAYIWARQKGITFGWADGKFHPEAKLSTPSTVAFMYRYQKAMGQVTPKAPTYPSLPKNGSLPGNQDAPQSASGWQHKVRQGSAFWREAQWAVDHRMWGYHVEEEYIYEDFDKSFVSSGDLALMLYRLEHGGSHLR